MRANFKNRRLIAWIAFVAILITLVTTFFVEINNEAVVNTILMCLTALVISYFTGASVEDININKNKSKIREED